MTSIFYMRSEDKATWPSSKSNDQRLGTFPLSGATARAGPGHRCSSARDAWEGDSWAQELTGMRATLPSDSNSLYLCQGNEGAGLNQEF